MPLGAGQRALICCHVHKGAATLQQQAPDAMQVRLHAVPLAIHALGLQAPWEKLEHGGWRKLNAGGSHWQPAGAKEHEASPAGKVRHHLRGRSSAAGIRPMTGWQPAKSKSI